MGREIQLWILQRGLDGALAPTQCLCEEDPSVRKEVSAWGMGQGPRGRRRCGRVLGRAGGSGRTVPGTWSWDPAALPR